MFSGLELKYLLIAILTAQYLREPVHDNENRLTCVLRFFSGGTQLSVKTLNHQDFNCLSLALLVCPVYSFVML